VTVIGRETNTAIVSTITASSFVTPTSSIGTTPTSTDPTSSGTSSAPPTDLVSEPKPDYSVPIGVGVGAPLGVMALGMLVYLYLRHRRHAAAKQKQVEEKNSTYAQPIYAYGAELSNWSKPGELSTSPDPHELSAERNHVKGVP
jgi:hypothetical protein